MIREMTIMTRKLFSVGQYSVGILSFLLLWACSRDTDLMSHDLYSSGGSSAPEISTTVPSELNHLGNRPSDLHRLKIKAVDGDAEAAAWVVEYYSMMKPDAREENAFWFEVAVENGSSLWIDTKAQELAHEGGVYKCRRAIFLEQRAISFNPKERAVYEAHIKSFEPQCRS